MLICGRTRSPRFARLNATAGPSRCRTVLERAILRGEPRIGQQVRISQKVADFLVVIRQALLRADKWALGRTVFSSKRQLVIVYPADEVLLVQTLFDPAQRRAAMPVDQDAVQIDRKEVDALTRWIESDGRADSLAGTAG